ncbi:hypothetical protein LMG28727_02659 [Paraburkholderia kirstenboschensis]|uniref:hypothetical protein n=1 Tax=Paraburkholderia kirstenboschensis TaxID=1245436 RepID=UPI000A6E09DC|nr:hypothetical protein [Paraburkholderia kirstenboschensis]CAD6530453.1 hypothetical protein LMG28727_02659 [Paraburkholderia kirstenboschensis]
MAIGAGIALVAVAYSGYVHSYLDHEIQTTFFIKRHPTLQIEFDDPFANEGDDIPIDRLPPSDRSHFADYCKYRFGVTDSSTEALEACKARIPGYL